MNTENRNNNMNPYIVEMFDSIMADENDNDNDKENSIKIDNILDKEIEKINIKNEKSYKQNEIQNDKQNNDEQTLSTYALIGAFLYIIISMPHSNKLLEKISPSLIENNYKNIIMKAMIFAIIFIIIAKYLKFDKKFLLNFYPISYIYHN